MAIYEDREAFIPHRRTDLIQLCLEDGKLAAPERQKFQDFCEILCAYYHFHFHQILERLKNNYAPFNPDTDTQSLQPLTSEQQKTMEIQLVEDLKEILERANYTSFSKQNLEQAFEEKSLIDLRTNLNFDDFTQMICYSRGDIYKNISIKRFFRKIKRRIDIFERVVLLIKFQEKEYFENNEKKKKKLKFTPGKIYLSCYKNIPKMDIEFLFPNVKTSMTWKDRLLLIVPAVGAAVPMVVKLLPQIAFTVVLLNTLFSNSNHFITLNLSEEEYRQLMATVIAVLSLGITFGGFAFKQYTSYQNKKLTFQKDVTETLFFRNLASNAAVLHSLIDSAEEEECKEMILVYYHLLIQKNRLTPEQLDNQIEAWMEEKLGTKIDFDIQGPLDNLAVISGRIREEEMSLLTYDSLGYCCIPSLDDAKTVIDYVWDRAFTYNDLP